MKRLLLLSMLILISGAFSACDDDDGADVCNANGVCEPGSAENAANCPEDCLGHCGDAICDEEETEISCPQDCSPGPVCGDDICEGAEDASNCPEDCAGETCSQEGDMRCTGDLLETCEITGDGTLLWSAEDCSLSGMVCDSTGEIPTCVAECADECADGDVRCNNNAVEFCLTDDTGCWLWTTGDTCSNYGSSYVCVEEGPVGAQCVDACTHECDTVDARQCSGDTIQVCAEDASGCRLWTDAIDCTTISQTCSAGACEGADTAAYNTSFFMGSFAFISGTSLTGTFNLIDDQRYYVTLPFDFSYYGSTYNEIWITTNGWVSLGSDPGTNDNSNVSLPSAFAPLYGIFPFWDNLAFYSEHTSNGDPNDWGWPDADMSYTVSGTAPTRVFTIEWRDFTISGDGGDPPFSRISFQVKLYETLNEIEVLYDRTNAYGSFSATVGLSGGPLPGGSFAGEQTHMTDQAPGQDIRYTPYLQ